MLFNTATYFVFFGLTALTYWALSHRKQNLLLLGASCVFYGWWDWRFLSLLLASAVVDYTMGIRIAAARDRDDGPAARRSLIFSIVFNLGVLGFFKYFNFFTESAEQALRTLGYDGSLWTLNVILPVGISFYTFQTMSYTFDVYRGVVAPTRRLLDFVLFVCFFPQLVAGPIERASTLLTQIERPRRLGERDVGEGLLLFGLGLFRKVVIADSAGVLADEYFADPARYTSIQLAVGLLLYSIQIYNDFAGYSDMARGSARLLGFRLVRNFHHPYFASSMSDFWSRWHISLSRWLRDYLYISLGGSRRGPARTTVNLMTTMLLGGLWHGANWTFVIWGALHGGYLGLQHAWRWLLPRAADDSPGVLHRAASVAAVFAVVTLTWVFFRAPDIATAGLYLGTLFRFTAGSEGAILPLLVLASLTLAIDVPHAAANDEYVFLEWPAGRQAAAASAATVLLLVSGSANAPFIYFQF